MNVISYNPSSFSETIQRILLGEATLSIDESADINAIRDSTMSTMTKLDEKVDRLEELMRTTLQQQLRPLQYPRPPQYLGPPQYPRLQRYDRPPTVICRVCGLNGHYAPNCRRDNNLGQPPRNYGTFQSQRYTPVGNPEQRYNRGYFPTNRGAYNNRFNNNTRDYGRYNYENRGSTSYGAKKRQPTSRLIEQNSKRYTQNVNNRIVENVCENEYNLMRGTGVCGNKENVLLLQDNNKINVSIAGHGLQALIDSGSTISTISEYVFQDLCKNMQTNIKNTTKHCMLANGSQV